MADLPPHLTGERTNRGLLWMPEIPSRHHERGVVVHESSAASEPCIWLRVQPADGGYEVAHLTAGQAWRLKEQIEHLLANHYQGDARPVEHHPADCAGNCCVTDDRPPYTGPTGDTDG